MKNTPILEQAFDPEIFEKNGVDLIKLLSQYLEDVSVDKLPVTQHVDPNKEYQHWEDNFPMASGGTADPIDLFKAILARSIHVHHPHYIGHQVATTAPLAALSNVFSGLLNNGMAIYEMGAAASAIERLVTDYMCTKIGYQNGTGILTSGGTLANLTAMLAARSAMIENEVWTKGHQEGHVVFVSDAAHYCVDRALRIMGFGDAGIVKIETDEHFKMTTESLQSQYETQTNLGNKVMAIVASAPSTSTGTYEDLNSIGAFCRKINCWFHVDAAHGGAAIFSEKYKHLLTSVETADSIVIDVHKMMLAPGIMTFLLFKNKSDSYATFSQKAEYLWNDDQSDEWFNYGKRTFECTKEMMGVKFFVMQQVYGDKLFEEYVDNQYDLARAFAKLIRDRKNFELAHEPDSNIVCFRYTNQETDIDQLNASIRKSMLDEGKYYIVQTKLKGKTYLRVTIMNHLTNENILKELLDEIERLACL